MVLAGPRPLEPEGAERPRDQWHEGPLIPFANYFIYVPYDTQTNIYIHCGSWKTCFCFPNGSAPGNND